MIFFICRTEHFNLLEKILKSSRAYFHFINGTTKHGEKARNGAVRIKSNQIKIKSNQIKSNRKSKIKLKTRL